MTSFSFRVARWFSLLVTGTTAALLGLGGWLLHGQLISSIEAMHDVEGAELGRLIGPHPALTETELAARIETDADSDAALFYIQVEQTNGAVRFRSDNLGDARLPFLPGRGPRYRADVAGRGPLWISEYTAAGWRILIGSRLAPVFLVLRDYARVSALLVLGAAAVSVVIGWAFSRLVLRPVQAIERTARHLDADTLGARIPLPPGNDELTALAKLLNELFDRLQVSFAQIRRFTADASHELKTPLAIIRLNLEKLRRQRPTDSAQSALCDELLEDVERLHRIIERLLFLSRAESGSLQIVAQSFEANDWVNEVAEDARVLAEEHQVSFRIERADTGTLTGDPQLLRQLVLNLISNALRFSPPSSEVTFACARQTKHWELVVRDAGPGVPSAELDRIFERFVRLPQSESAQHAPGHGLGLAICRSIASLHGGTVRAENRRDRSGLIVIVKLPDRSPHRGSARSESSATADVGRGGGRP